MKHTPGPWQVSQHNPHEIYGESEYIGTANHYKILGKGEKKENIRLFNKNRANAKLMALAPSMVALIKSAEFVYIGGKYLAILEPDHVKSMVREIDK